MFKGRARKEPDVLVSKYLQAATPVASDEIAWRFKPKLCSRSVRNTTPQLMEGCHIFQPYVSLAEISPDRCRRNYVEPLSEIPDISFKTREYVDRDLAQTEPDIGTWSNSCATMCVIVLKSTVHITAIAGVRHLSATKTPMLLSIQGKSAE